MQGSVAKNITVVTDGAEAIEYVRRRGQFADSPRPDLVLLDLNLPKRDGLEVLREIKSDPDLRSITVVVLTTSRFPRDVTTAYELSANCYIVKPAELEEYYSVMRSIEEFWMSLATLPTLGKEPDTADEIIEKKDRNNHLGKAKAPGARHARRPRVREWSFGRRASA
jgi:CheY-like chemotaxis protein